MSNEKVDVSFSNIKTLKMKDGLAIFTLTKTDTQAVITMERERDSDVHVIMAISHATMQRIIDFWEE